MSLLDTLLAPARRLEGAQEQDALREKMQSRLPHRLSQSNYLYGLARESMALVGLESLHSHGIDDPSLLSPVLEQLAEGYALQSRFVEAATTATSASAQKEYAAKAEAVAAIGLRRCNCAPTVHYRLPSDAKGLTLPSLSETDKVWDGRREIVFSRCRLCGTLSASEARA